MTIFLVGYCDDVFSGSIQPFLQYLIAGRGNYVMYHLNDRGLRNDDYWIESSFTTLFILLEVEI